MRLLLLALVLLVAPGCFISKTSRHRPIEADRVAELEPGVTTAGQALELLGAPTEVVQLGRRSAYRYDHGVQKQAALFLLILGLRGVDSTEDRSWLFFDEQDVLSHVGTTLEAEDARYRVPLLRD